MTNTTTDELRLKRSTRSLLWTASIVVHVALLAALLIWGQDLLVLDRSAADERSEAVKERSKRLVEQQRIEREQRRLDRETAEALQREEHRKRQRDMAEHLEKMAAAREELEEVRKAKLDQIRNRQREEIQNGELDRLEHEAAKLLGHVNNYQDDTERDESLATSLRKEAVEINWAAGHDKRLTPEQIRENAKDIIVQLQEMKEQIAAHPKPPHRHLWHVNRQIDEVEKVARMVAGEFDLEQYNDLAASNLESKPRADDPAKPAAPAEAYDRAVAVEEQINEIRQDIAAAEIAQAANLPFSEAMERVANSSPERPDYGEKLRDAPVQTIGQLNDYRELLDKARDETERMAVRADGAAQRYRGEDKAAQALARKLTNSRQWTHQLGLSRGEILDLSSVMRAANQGAGSHGGDSSGGDADWSGRGSDMTVIDVSQGDKGVSAREVYAHALPGRRFGADAARKGWLFIDTWYIIGPWQRQKGAGFTGVFPPETGVDLDAEYADGYVVPDKKLDGQLAWKFHQADGLRVQPPVVVGGAVYYAYTDVYFEEAQDMLLAIASDDAAKVWINDMVVWADRGLSSWRLDEGFRKVAFKQGYNRVLVRFENGPGYCYFSMLICPPHAVAG